MWFPTKRNFTTSDHTAVKYKVSQIKPFEYEFKFRLHHYIICPYGQPKCKHHKLSK